MEHKINEVIVYNNKGEIIQLKVTPTINNTCKDCFFYGHYDICSDIRDIIGICDKIDRTDNIPVIFKQINNKIMKKTIYTVMQTSKKDRDLCYNFTSFKEANKQFEKFLQMWEKANNVKAKSWTSPAAPYQLKVSRIGDITLYLCKESIEIDIEDDSNKQSSEIYKKDVLGKWINVDDIDPIKIKDLKSGDYIILRVQYDSTKFDYKLAYVDYINYGKVIFNIQSINILRTPIKITDFCILPSYSSNNFYKTNK